MVGWMILLSDPRGKIGKKGFDILRTLFNNVNNYLKRMKGKLLLVLILITSVTALAGTPVDSVSFQRERANVLEMEFGKIRASIVKKVCDIFDYKNSIVRDKISNKSLKPFQDAISQDTLCPVALRVCFAEIRQVPNSGDLLACKYSVTSFLEQVKEWCEKNDKDVTWKEDIDKQILALEQECKVFDYCYKDGIFGKYNSKYPKGHFKDFERFFIQPEEIEKVTDNDVNGENAGNVTEKTTDEQTKTDLDKNRVSSNGSNNGEETGLFSKFLRYLIIIFIMAGGLVLFFRIRRKCKSAPKLVSKPEAKPEAEPEAEPEAKPEANPNVLPEWVIVGASVKGNGHIQSNMPCQDNNKFEFLGEGWGVAIVSDGAGSAAHSELGSKVVVERGIIHFTNLIEKEGWKKNNVLPTDAEWLQKAYYTLKRIRDEVEMVANHNKIEFKSLSSTCLVVVFSPLGLLSAHIGDGRMGYKTVSGEWKSMMTPHKGAEANQTIFLTSDFWSIPNYVMCGVLVPETIVVRQPVQAFVLMSDGCENTAWECTTRNPETGKYYDRNKPFARFFNPLEETLVSFSSEGIPDNERQSKWYKFIESGTVGFVREQDDKTMVYALNVNLRSRYDS